MAVLAIDFDNTLIVGDKWLPGALDALKLFREKGHKVIIHSCNNSAWISKCLREDVTPVDGIWYGVGKPLADLYIDDKGYHHPHNTPWDDEEVSKVLLRIEGLDNRKW